MKRRSHGRLTFSEEDKRVAAEMAEYTSLLMAASLRGAHSENSLLSTQRLNCLWHFFLKVRPQ